MITAFLQTLLNMFEFKLKYNVSVHSHQLSKKNSITHNYKEPRKKAQKAICEIRTDVAVKNTLLFLKLRILKLK